MASEAKPVGGNVDGQETKTPLGTLAGDPEAKGLGQGALQASGLASFLDPGGLYRQSIPDCKSVRTEGQDETFPTAGDGCQVVGNQLSADACPAAQLDGGEGQSAETASGGENGLSDPSGINKGSVNRQTGQNPLENEGVLAVLHRGPESEEGNPWARGPLRATVGGWDTVHVSFYGEFNPDAWKRWRAVWESAKGKAQLLRDLGGGSVPFDGPEGESFLMQAGATKHGATCRYCFRRDGVTVQVVDNPQFSEHRLSVFVEIGSNPLVVLGLAEVHVWVKRMLAGFGFVERFHKVARADACVDLVGCDMRPFMDHIKAGRYVCQNRKEGGDGERMYLETAYFGSRKGGDILCRIYDKVRQCNGDKIKAGIMSECRWGCPGQLPEGGATRVEFEMRGKELRRRFGVETVEDLLTKGGAIVEWLTGSWLRFTETVPDRENGHQARAMSSKLWERVRAQFLEAFGEPVEYSGILPAMEIDQDLAVLTAIGHLKRALVFRGKIPESREHYLTILGALLEEKIDETRFQSDRDDIKARRLELEAGLPCVSALGLDRPVTDTFGDRKPGTWVF
jgi:hypothetical protein